MSIARTRGMASGLMLLVLGAWAAIVPFIGDYLGFAYTPTSTWTWTEARGWYEVLPGAVAFVGGLLLLTSAHRMVAMLGAWMGVAAGAWLVIGPQIADVLSLGTLGTPMGSSGTVHALERLFYFYAIGAGMLYFASAAVGRLSVRSLRDIRAARARELAAAPVAAAPAAAPATAPVAPPPTAAAPVPARTNRPHHGHFSFWHRHRDEADTTSEYAARHDDRR
jgi:hypothetical protein